MTGEVRELLERAFHVRSPSERARLMAELIYQMRGVHKQLGGLSHTVGYFSLPATVP